MCDIFLPYSFFYNYIVQRIFLQVLVSMFINRLKYYEEIMVVFSIHRFNYCFAASVQWKLPTMDYAVVLVVLAYKTNNFTHNI